MRMQTIPGRRIMTIAGHHYSADHDGVIEDVAPEDVSELQHVVGCRVLPTPAPAPPPAEAVPPPPAEAVEDLPTGRLEPAAAGHHEAPEHSDAEPT